MSTAARPRDQKLGAAPLWRRMMAMVIDAIPAALVVALSFATGWLEVAIFRRPQGWFWSEWIFKFWLDDRAALALPVAAFFVSAITWTTLWEAISGRSPGARIMQLLVVDKSAFKVSATRAVLRGIGAGLNLASLGLGYLWIYVSSYGRGWHDYLSGTLVIDAGN